MRFSVKAFFILVSVFSLAKGYKKYEKPIAVGGEAPLTRDVNLGVDSNFQCPPGTTIAPHPQRCELYYTCYGGQPVYLWQCRDNLLFDLTYNGCNWPEQTYCGNRTRPGESTPAPYTCSQDGFFASDSSRCVQTYYTCLDGTAYSTACPSYGVFEPNRRICVSPSSSSCQTLVTGTTSVVVNPTTVVVNPTTTKVASSSSAFVTATGSTTKNPSVTTAPSGSFQCPSENGNYPDPASCTGYYTCNSGIAYYFTCPGGLVYNPVTKVCDWPANVPGC